MSDSQPVGCAKPVGGAKVPEAEVREDPSTIQNKGARVMIKAGQRAPDFAAGAYFDGGFTTVNLSNYLGKWVALCFYPGDFTFV